MFSPDKTQVALVEKQTGPEELKGKWNGIGGKLEQHEGLADAMVREFREETGVTLGKEHWEHFCTIRGIFRNGQEWIVNFFRAFHIAVHAVRQMEHEKIDIFLTAHVGSSARDIPIPHNIRWLMPLALDPQINIAFVEEK